MIGNLYRPPHKLNDHFNIFLGEFTDIMQTISTSKIKCFIAGDTNIDLFKINENSTSELFYNTVISAAFKPLITLLTRLSTRNSLIDNIFTNNSEKMFSGMLSSHISDHQMYFTSLSFNTFPNTHIPKFIQKPLSMDICLNRFSEAVENKLNNDIYNNYNQFTPDENYDKLEKVLLDSHKIAFITKTVRFNKKKHFVKDWMTSSILKSVNYKNKLYLKQKQCKSICKP